MKKNNLNQSFLMSVLIFLGHFCFGQNLIGKSHLKKMNVFLGLSLNSDYQGNKEKIFKAFKIFPIDGVDYWHRNKFSTDFLLIISRL